jgi:hypothetical protein
MSEDHYGQMSEDHYGQMSEDHYGQMSEDHYGQMSDGVMVIMVRAEKHAEKQCIL